MSARLLAEFRRLLAQLAVHSCLAQLFQSLSLGGQLKVAKSIMDYFDVHHLHC